MSSVYFCEKVNGNTLEINYQLGNGEQEKENGT